MSTRGKQTSVNCATGCVDKTPKFMEERQRVIGLIDSVYKRFDAEKLETPIFELKEVFSNNKNKFDRIMDLNDQGGEILAMRYDLKTSLTRYLAMLKIEKHICISQFGNVFRKEPINYDKMRLREFFVSDFDICGPSDTMMSEVQCLRVACDVIKALSINESYTVKIGHRKLTECFLRLETIIKDWEVASLVGKLADESRHSAIVWSNIDSLIGSDKITSAHLNEFKARVHSYSGDFGTKMDLLKSDKAFNDFGDIKSIIEEMVVLNKYCKTFLSLSDYNKLELDLSLVGPRSYYTGMIFAVSLNEADKNVLSGGRYDNLIARFNPKSKFKNTCTGFTIGIDQLVHHRLMNTGSVDLLFPPDDQQNAEPLEDKLKDCHTADEKKSEDDDSNLKNVKGSLDRNPQQMIIREKVFGTVIECFKRYNAVTIDTPVIERKDVLAGKYGEDSKLIYDLNDIDNEKLSLRYDLTVPFARYLAMHKDLVGPNKMFKRYQIGKVYRRDKPSITSGRYREFYQCDFDVAGDSSDNPMAPDAECLKIVYEVLRDLNLGEYKIKVNHRMFLDGLFEVCGVPNDMFRTICSSVDKLDKTPWQNVCSEMVSKGLSEESANKIGEYVKKRGNLNLINELEKDSVLYSNANVQVALRDLRLLFEKCSELMDKISFDLSLARGLDYYTGLIFEAIFIGFESRTPTGDTPVNKEGDEDISVGSVAGGGRYDKLVNMFSSSDNDTPCVGFSVGIERLMAIFEKKKLIQGYVDPNRKPVAVFNVQKDLIFERLNLVSMLLDNGLTVVHSMKKNPKALDVFQECEKQKIPLAVIIGEDELKNSTVKLRHINTRKEEIISRHDIVSRLKTELGL